MPESQTNSSNRIWLVFGLVALVPFAFGAILWGCAHGKLGPQPKLDALGNYGSYLQGTVASLWALAGVILVAGAFLAQASQLRLQRRQLDEQREQFTKESFEQTFFKLLDLQNRISSEMTATCRAGPMDEHVESVKGKDCIEHLLLNFTHDFGWAVMNVGLGAQLDPRNQPPEIDLLGMARECYDRFWDEQSSALGHYFRSYSHIIRSIEESGVPNKQWYADLACVQLSSLETGLLFYHGISNQGQELKPLIEKFGLLKDLDRELLVNPTDVEFYNASAFKI